MVFRSLLLMRFGAAAARDSSGEPSPEKDVSSGGCLLLASWLMAEVRTCLFNNSTISGPFVMNHGAIVGSFHALSHCANSCGRSWHSSAEFRPTTIDPRPFHFPTVTVWCLLAWNRHAAFLAQGLPLARILGLRQRKMVGKTAVWLTVGRIGRFWSCCSHRRQRRRRPRCSVAGHVPEPFLAEESPYGRLRI